MFVFLRVGIIAVALAAASMQRVVAADMLGLTGAAHAYGFIFVTHETEAAVQLARPGISVLIRAGNPRYQVNDDVRYLARAPVVRNNQIYVDAAFERTLADLAAAHPWPVALVVPPAAVAAAAPLTLTIGAKYVEGTSNIAISGTGPAGFALVVVLKARMSRDIPIVTIGSTTAKIGSDGRYEAIVPAGSIVLHETAFIASARGPGLEPVTARVEIQPPNPNLHSSNDGLPKG